jgi:regulator of sigma E protease
MTVQIIQFFVSLSLLIVLHEFGHFLPARLFGTRVEKFFLFFDIKFALFKKKIGDTEYGIGWLPLGGYVKIAGMIDESMDKAQMAEEPKPWEFRSKPTWQRLIIMLGGVTVNFVLAIIIYIGLAFAYGDEYIENDSLKGGVWVVEETIGSKIGIQTGDQIVAVDGQPIDRFSAVFLELVNGNEVTIKRDGQLITQPIPVDFIATLIDDESKARFLSYRIPFIVGQVPEDSQNVNSGLQPEDQITRIGDTPIAFFDEAKAVIAQYSGQETTLSVQRKDEAFETQIRVQVSDSATIGVIPAAASAYRLAEMGYLSIQTQKYGFFEAIPAGIDKGVSTLSSYVKQFKKIVNPSTGAYKGVGGFAAIGSMFPTVWDWRSFWSTTALISIILAFMNVLPIPALDGGHVMFLLYEMISGRKPSDKALEIGQMIGFALILALVIFANGNDLFRFLFK